MRRDSFWRDAVALLVLAGIAALLSNALAGPERKLRWIGSFSDGAPPVATPRSAPAAPLSSVPPGEGAQAFLPHPEKAWVEISGDAAAALFARKNVLFLDARRTSVYRDGHIAGARSIAVWEADADDRVKALFAEGLDQRAPIVMYCSGGECEDSHMLAQKLYFVGFDNVLVYRDGFPDWQKRGLPVTRGEAP